MKPNNESVSEYSLALDLCDVAGKVFKGKNGQGYVRVRWMPLNLNHVDLRQLSDHSGISVEKLERLVDASREAMYTLLTDEERRSIIDGVAAMIKAQPYAIVALHGPDHWGE
jgi:hypothetical protein